MSAFIHILTYQADTAVAEISLAFAVDSAASGVGIKLHRGQASRGAQWKEVLPGCDCLSW